MVPLDFFRGFWLFFFFLISFWRETLFISVVGLDKAIKFMLRGKRLKALNYLKSKLHKVLLFVHVVCRERREGDPQTIIFSGYT